MTKQITPAFRYIVVETVEGALNTFSAELWPDRIAAVDEVTKRVKAVLTDAKQTDNDFPWDVDTEIAHIKRVLGTGNSYDDDFSGHEFSIVEIREPDQPASD